MPKSLVNSGNCNSCWSLGAEMDYKELPAPPPPSPELRAAHHTGQPIDESLLLSRSDFATPQDHSYTTLEADTTRHIAAAHHSTLKNSPLRQVASQVDVDTNSSRHSTSNHKRRFGGSLTSKSANHRRATLPSPTGRERSSSTSSPSQGVSKSSPSRHASPAFNMAYLRSTIQVIPITPRASSSNHSRSFFDVSPRPPLRGRQISSPIMAQHPSSPSLFSSPRPVTPSSSTPQSRSQSFSTQSTELSQSEELASYFSTDSEDEEEAEKGFRLPPSSKHGSIDKRSGSGRKFRRRVSETFAFFTCGKE